LYSDRPRLNVYYYHEDNPEKKIERNSPEILRMREEFKNELCQETLNTMSQKWKNMVFVGMLSTALCVYLTASFVWFSKVDYGFLKGALVLFLIIFLIIRIQKIFYPNASIYFYPLKFISIFHVMLLLVYDFNRLEKLVAKGDESWSAAVNIALSLYMDIILIFMLFLERIANESW
jgi:FtsH-binding integral membrane protein